MRFCGLEISLCSTIESSLWTRLGGCLNHVSCIRSSLTGRFFGFFRLLNCLDNGICLVEESPFSNHLMDPGIQIFREINSGFCET